MFSHRSSEPGVLERISVPAMPAQGARRSARRRLASEQRPGSFISHKWQSRDCMGARGASEHMSRSRFLQLDGKR